jgi:DNA-binding transcriptional MerR regulator
VIGITSYRYYELDQLPRLNRIIALKELGFSLEQVGTVLAENPTAEQMRALLGDRREQLAADLEQSRRRLEQVDVRLAQIEREGVPPDEFEVVHRSLPALTVVSLRGVVPSVDRVGALCDEHFARIAVWLAERNIAADGLTLGLYHMDEYRETDLDMESAIVVDTDRAEGLTAPGAGTVSAHTISAEPQAAGLVLRRWISTSLASRPRGKRDPLVDASAVNPR